MNDLLNTLFSNNNDIKPFRLVSGQSKHIRQYITNAIYQSARQKKRPIVIIDFENKGNYTQSILNSYGYHRVDRHNGGEKDLFMGKSGIFSIAELVRMNGCTEKDFNQVCKYLPFLSLLDSLEAGKEIPFTLDMLEKYASSSSVEQQINKLENNYIISPDQSQSLRVQYSEIREVAQTLENLLLFRLRPCNGFWNFRNLLSDEIIFCHIPYFCDAETAKLLYQLIKLSIRKGLLIDYEIIIIDSRLYQKGLLNLIEAAKEHVASLTLISEDVFAGRTEDEGRYLTSLFNHYLYSRHTSYFSAVTISNSLGKFYRIQKTKGYARDHRLSSNKLADRLLGTNYVYQESHSPVLENLYPAEDIIKMEEHIALYVNASGESSYISIS